VRHAKPGNQINMRKYLGTIMMLLIACGSFAQSSFIDRRLAQFSRETDNPKEQVDSLVQLYGDMLKEMKPTTASFAYGFKAYDGRWTDISSQASGRNKAWYQQILAAIKKINKTGISKTDALYVSLIENSASESV